MSTPYRTAPSVDLDAADEALDFWLRLEVAARDREQQALLRALWCYVEVNRLADHLELRRARLAALKQLAAVSDSVDAATLATWAPEIAGLSVLMDMAPMHPVQI